MMLRQMLSFQISIGEKETDLLQQLNGDELLILSERYEMIKTSEDLAEQVRQIVSQRRERKINLNEFPESEAYREIGEIL